MTSKLTLRLKDFILAAKGKCAFVPTETIHNRQRCVKLKNRHDFRIKVADAVLNNFKLFEIFNMKYANQLDEVRQILLDGMADSGRKYLYFTILQAGAFLCLDPNLPFEFDEETTIDTFTDEEEINRFAKVLETLIDSVGEVTKSLRKLNRKIDNEGDDEV